MPKNTEQMAVYAVFGTLIGALMDAEKRVAELENEIEVVDKEIDGMRLDIASLSVRLSMMEGAKK